MKPEVRAAWVEVMALDGYKCASPFCTKLPDLWHRILDVHHLLGKKHNKAEEQITLCRCCHNIAEVGQTVDGVRESARQFEIRILEWYNTYRPDDFRWDDVLTDFLRQQKASF